MTYAADDNALLLATITPVASTMRLTADAASTAAPLPTSESSSVRHAILARTRSSFRRKRDAFMPPIYACVVPLLWTFREVISGIVAMSSLSSSCIPMANPQGGGECVRA